MNQNQDIIALEMGAVIDAPSEYVLVEPGKYHFTVINYTTTLFNGSSKCPPCTIVKVVLKVDEYVDCFVNESFFMTSANQKVIWNFFNSIGLVNKGEQLKINWDAAIGKHGYAEFYNKESNGNMYNHVKHYISPENDEKAQGATSWKAGKF